MYMIKYTLFLTEKQISLLKELSTEEKTMSYHIRKAITRYLKSKRKLLLSIYSPSNETKRDS